MRQSFQADAARYALYFTPPVANLWWQSGSRWLGRDAAMPATTPAPQQPDVPGLTSHQMQVLTANPRHYGFHATLKAPFLLAQGFTQDQLLSMAEAFARTERPLVMPKLQVQQLDAYLALCFADRADDISALAMRCVAHFDALRAAPHTAEIARRRHAGLSARQEQLLARWGYPFTEELYRFHMTLTGNLQGIDAATIATLHDAAVTHFQTVIAEEAPMLDALTVCIEPAPGEPFSILQRFPFPSAKAAATTQRGRLFYMVGPSGVGKDSLLQWLQQHLGDNTRTVFARRAITREPHPCELHEAIDTDTFWEQVCHGEFLMFWQANGACYGVRREIEADMRAGRDVIVNGSRAYAPCVQQAFPQAQIIWITADPETISRRLIARQRETGAALIERVSKATMNTPPADKNVIAIDNSGALDIAGAKLLSLLQRS